MELATAQGHRFYMRMNKWLKADLTALEIELLPNDTSKVSIHGLSVK